MALKEIEIIGFKSFADKVKVKFTGGTTCVVGPNGCGKSNIVDAIKWALGELSPKSLRGTSMSDVIFSGTAKRKALNFAEVTIVFDNSNDLFPIEYDTVGITRRLHRSGESQYFVNKQPVRLKDIHELMAGSGVGKNAFAILEQGRIDELIHKSPDERRSFIEEVAGTSLFAKKKVETVRRLKQTEDNLLRLEDIVTEVEKQLKQAEKHAEKAMQFKELKERYENLDRALLVTRWRKATNELTEKQSAFEGGTGALNEVAADLEKKRVELHEAKLFGDEREQVYRRKQEALFEARNQKELKLQSLRQSEQKRQESLVRETNIKEELQEISAARENYLKEQHEAKESQQLLEKDLSSVEEEVRSERETTKQLEINVGELREQQVASQRDRMQLVQEVGQLENQQQASQLRLEQQQKLHEKSHYRASELAKQQVAIAEKFSESANELTMAQERVKEANVRVVELQKCVKNSEESLESAQEEEKRIERELSDVKGRLNLLQRMRTEMEGFSKASKTLLADSSLNAEPLVSSLKLTKEESVRLRSYAQTIVVKTEQDLVSLLAAAAAKKLKDFSVICLAYLDSNKSLREHFFEHILIVDDPLKALRDGKSGPFFGADGSFVDARGVFSKPSLEGMDTFSREAELRELEERLTILEANLEVKSQERAHHAKKSENLRHQMREGNKELNEKERAVVEADFTLQKLSTDLERFKSEAERFSQESKDASVEIEQLQEKIKIFTQELESAQKRSQEAKQKQLDAEMQYGDREKSLKAAVRSLRDKEQFLQQRLDKSQEFNYRLNMLEMRLQEGDKREEKLIRELDHLVAVRAQLDTIETDNDDALQEVTASLEKVTKAVEEEQQLITKQKERIQQLEEIVDKLHKDKTSFMEKNTSWEVRITQLQTLAEGYENDLREKYQESTDIEIEEIQHLGEAEQELKSIKRRLDGIGAVNFAAIEEKDEYIQRYEHLTTQIQDMTASKEELETIIAELDDKCRDLFVNAFKQVQENFRKNFEILFRGGEADLRLVGDEDVLSAGIEIAAKPPGKQMRSMTLLSGGEKCLTSLALLFALFEVKSAPFCLLDEVDAPLDDTNIERFVMLLQEFKSKCQFVIVTHNKRTMAIAETIYGVSMEERGVSRLLTLRFSEEKEEEFVLSAT